MVIILLAALIFTAATTDNRQRVEPTTKDIYNAERATR